MSATNFDKSPLNKLALTINKDIASATFNISSFFDKINKLLTISFFLFSEISTLNNLIKVLISSKICSILFPFNVSRHFENKK